MMINRKLRKLVFHPVQFFQDMKLKREREVAMLLPKRKQGVTSYTVVAAVYNVGRYLDEFFQSIVDQRLDFENNIHLVMVDDGSPDNSAEIIARWVARYPQNITYVRKDNGGQASARNYGLSFVKTPWVSFVDPDDVLDPNYFLELDNFLRRYDDRKLQMLSANFIFYFEETKKLSNTHPMRYRFSKGSVIKPFDDLGRHLQLSVNSAIFRADVIRDREIRFDERIRPSFEDAHFVGSYLCALEEGSVAYVPKAKYLYRKRHDASSTLDTAWSKLGLYGDVIEFGCLDMLRRFHARYGRVPVHVQRTVLYHFIWYFNRLVNAPERVAFLAEGQRARFLGLMRECFSYIDAQTIMDFELGNPWQMQRVGMLNLFKGESASTQLAYVQRYDAAKGEVLVRYYAGTSDSERFKLSGSPLMPVEAKDANYDFCGELFAIERSAWLPIRRVSEDAELSVEIGGVPATLVMGKSRDVAFSAGQIRDYFAAEIREHERLARGEDLWVLMDRDDRADDNAEHLYRYLKQAYPTQAAVFVLRRDSIDWSRLQAEGFDLVEFGSDRHAAVLRRCSKIISSHIDKYVVDYFGDRSLDHKRVVFLQHGVTTNDLSSWLNPKHRIDLLVTASSQEHEAFCGQGSKYRLMPKDVVLAGFPRHDHLLAGESEKIVLIMPTWRSSLVGVAKDGNRRQRNAAFMSSEFAQQWSSLLQSDRLKELVQSHGYRAVFVPHPNLMPYLSEFGIPDYIEQFNPAEGSIQTYFKRARFMLTDYSSVNMEMAYQKKAVVYFQFDEEAFFSGQHTVRRGYFSYRQDGFGEVASDLEQALDAIERILVNDGQPLGEHLQRMERFFAHRDGKCCHRVVSAIYAMDMPRPPIRHQNAKHLEVTQ